MPSLPPPARGFTMLAPPMLRGLVSQKALMGALFWYSNQARYTAGLKDEPGWLISVAWSISPLTRRSVVFEGSMFETYTMICPVRGSIVTTEPLWQLQLTSSPAA